MDDHQLDSRVATTVASVSGPTAIQEVQTEIDNLFETDQFSIAFPSKNNSGKENIVDSKTLSKKIKILMKALKNKNTSVEGKIKISEFICNKLCDIYQLSPEQTEIIIRELSNVIFDAVSMPVPLRLYYLKFRNENVPYPVSVNLFKNGIRDKMTVVPYFQILKYIIRSNADLVQKSQSEQVLDEFEQLFNNEDVSIYTKMEIADIFILNNRTKRGREMLNILRELEFQMVLNPDDANNAFLYQRMLTVYGDSQNVHATDVNESVLKACVHLMTIEQPNGFNSENVREILHTVSPQHSEHIDTVLERIEIDTSKFNYKDNMFGLHDIFSSLWAWINNHSSKEELYIRLIEEIVAMAKYCTTGHASRFINVIQGYSNDEGLHVRISDEQQIRAIVGHYLDTVMSNAPEDIASAMIGDDQSAFYKFIENKMNDRLPKLLEEYGEVQEHIISAVKSYSQWDYWNISENVLKHEEKPSQNSNYFIPELQLDKVNRCNLEYSNAPISDQVVFAPSSAPSSAPISDQVVFAPSSAPSSAPISAPSSAPISDQVVFAPSSALISDQVVFAPSSAPISDQVVFAPISDTPIICEETYDLVYTPNTNENSFISTTKKQEFLITDEVDNKSVTKDGRSCILM
jgi:hypothetical protein